MELKFTPTKNLQISIFRTPQESPSLISSIRSANQVKCNQPLFYGYLHRSSRFSSRKLGAHCCSSFNVFPRENSVHKSIELNPSKQPLPSKVEFLYPTSLGICSEPSDWPERDEIRRFTIEQKANNMGIPHSLRLRKQRGKLDSFVDNESGFAYSSVKNAISSLVFIIREIQNYTLIIRESLYSEDLVDVMSKIQQDMTLTFVWLFQQVFSKTPTLMVYVVLLLANFSVQSMAEKASFDVIQRQGFTQNVVTAIVLVSDKESEKEEQEDQYPKANDEIRLWEPMVEEASRIRGESVHDKALEYQIRQQLVSPLHVEVEPDNHEVHFRTNLVYQMRIVEQPNNSLLLTNYAQFLHLVVKDYDRAEEYFKRAIEVEPQDAEALGLYADFLWEVRNDQWGAEEMYIQAVEADTKNPFQVSKYANFLWSTGGEGTCFVFDESKE
ncbi:hypothetical protein ERO13_A06G164250v2 [Gossypium hirsutum]|uniref:Uncharacterized protein n=1 Tax=Gossypium hirsutum TaxID=3635 RepID=A0A1U8PXU7_GOSHI|nr:uncharacterized protein LOC107963118 [Gossypium hirsutum]KAG4196321.1 hypothetical protein ERO13_A06G164250v2 [Gossypium hirsutum]